MEKIASFTIDHIKLEPGIYVSRQDQFDGAWITTFDLRITSPNDEPVLNTAELHTLEHLCATYARNDPKWKDRIVYFGPMGCRTGCYLLLSGKLESRDIIDLIIGMFEFVRDFEGDGDAVPGAAAADCGNYLDHNLAMAKYVAKRYLERDLYHIDDAHLVYPRREE